MNFTQRLEAGGAVIFDGATGTELERRGVPMDGVAWCAAALATHPDTVREVHEDYIRAGAEVIITNTFPAARHVLEPAGLGDRFEELNTRAVELAKEARENAAEGEVWVAGSISTFPAGNDLARVPKEKEARANYREQAETLAEAGVDLIALEMLEDLAQASYAVEATVATGLPVSAGFSVKRGDDGGLVLWSGENTLTEALETVPLSGVSLVTVMHTLVEDTPDALGEVVERWSGPVGAYPHAGRFEMPNWIFIDQISPEEFAREAVGWHALGARVVGGCCGIGPDPIRALAERFAAER